MVQRPKRLRKILQRILQLDPETNSDNENEDIQDPPLGAGEAPERQERLPEANPRRQRHTFNKQGRPDDAFNISNFDNSPRVQPLAPIRNDSSMSLCGAIAFVIKSFFPWIFNRGRQEESPQNEGTDELNKTYVGGEEPSAVEGRHPTQSDNQLSQPRDIPIMNGRPTANNMLDEILPQTHLYVNELAENTHLHETRPDQFLSMNLGLPENNNSVAPITPSGNNVSNISTQNTRTRSANNSSTNNDSSQSLATAQMGGTPPTPLSQNNSTPQVNRAANNPNETERRAGPSKNFTVNIMQLNTNDVCQPLRDEMEKQTSKGITDALFHTADLFASNLALSMFRKRIENIDDSSHFIDTLLTFLRYETMSTDGTKCFPNQNKSCAKIFGSFEDKSLNKMEISQSKKERYTLDEAQQPMSSLSDHSWSSTGTTETIEILEVLKAKLSTVMRQAAQKNKASAFAITTTDMIEHEDFIKKIQQELVQVFAHIRDRSPKVLSYVLRNLQLISQENVSLFNLYMSMISRSTPLLTIRYFHINGQTFKSSMRRDRFI